MYVPGGIKDYRVNQNIRVPRVRLIDDEGEQMGIMLTRDALALAQERDLDLVEVAPNSDPPVCRLLDYGKFRYLQSTKEREVRKAQKVNALRQVRFRPRIGAHDIAAKERLVHRLLDQGSKVKVNVLFRGREMDHPELGMNLLKKVTEDIGDDAKLEQPPSMEGRMMSIILAPLTGVSLAKEETVEGEENAEAEDA
jgi:translation initiation factor IF-3